LVELDHDYARRAAELGVAPYIRVPALSAEPNFIEALATIAIDRLNDDDRPRPGSSFQCPHRWTQCPRAGQIKEKAA